MICDIFRYQATFSLYCLNSFCYIIVLECYFSLKQYDTLCRLCYTIIIIIHLLLLLLHGMFETFISTDNFNLRKDFRGKGQPRFFMQTGKKALITQLW